MCAVWTLSAEFICILAVQCKHLFAAFSVWCTCNRIKKQMLYSMVSTIYLAHCWPGWIYGSELGVLILFLIMLTEFVGCVEPWYTCLKLIMLCSFASIRCQEGKGIRPRSATQRSAGWWCRWFQNLHRRSGRRKSRCSCYWTRYALPWLILTDMLSYLSFLHTILKIFM